jgi:F1F0 ATPase subunit 2
VRSVTSTGGATIGTIMTDGIRLVLAALGGVAVGLLYFGGLWVTVRRLPTSRSPVVLTLVSFVGRLALVAVGFWVLMAGEPMRIGVALLGFLAVRIVLVRRVRSGVVLAGGGDAWRSPPTR